MEISTSILVVIVSIAHNIVGRLIVGKNRRKVSETSGKNIQKIGIATILIVAFGSLFFINILDTNVMKWFWLCLLILILGFYSFLEWKFLKESKEYVVSLIVLMIGLIYTLIFIF